MLFRSVGQGVYGREGLGVCHSHPTSPAQYVSMLACVGQGQIHALCPGATGCVCVTQTLCANTALNFVYPVQIVNPFLLSSLLSSHHPPLLFQRLLEAVSHLMKHSDISTPWEPHQRYLVNHRALFHRTATRRELETIQDLLLARRLA